jgi:hypothetical protein
LEQKSIFDLNGTPLRKNTEKSPMEKIKLMSKKVKLNIRKEKFLDEFRLEIAENVSLYPELEFKPVDDSEDFESYNKLNQKQKKIFKIQSSLFGRDLVKE